MVATAAATKKQYATAHARVLTATALLEEEQRAAVILIEEAHAVVVLIEPPSPMPPPVPGSGTAPSDDDYEAAVITNAPVQVADVQNIHSLISDTLDLSCMDYAWWWWW
jgi:hypothetical protein